MNRSKRVLTLVAAAFFLVANGFAGTIQADPPCVAGTVASYVALGAVGCTVGPLTFFNFQYSTTAAGPSGVPSATQAQIVPLTDSNGTGFQFVPSPGTFFANATGQSDADLKFIVRSTDASNIIRDLFLELAGTATGNGNDVLVETFCPGGTTLPPSIVCSASNTGTTLSNSPGLTLTSGTPSPRTQNFTNFSPTNSIATDKDMQATGNNGSATITGVKNQISIVPEPATSFIAGAGLVLIFLGSRRRSTR